MPSAGEVFSVTIGSVASRFLFVVNVIDTVSPALYMAGVLFSDGPAVIAGTVESTKNVADTGGVTCCVLPATSVSENAGKVYVPCTVAGITWYE